MNSKIWSFLLFVSSLMGYLEWAGNNHSFFFEAEVEILSKIVTNPTSVLHPFALLPLLGQALLCITLLQKAPSKTLIYVAMAALGVLLAFMVFVALLGISYRYKIMISTIPFWLVCIGTMRHLRKKTM